MKNMKRTLVVLGMVVALVGFIAVGAQADTVSSISITDSASFNADTFSAATVATFGSAGTVASGATNLFSGLSGDVADVSSTFNQLSWPSGTVTEQVEWTVSSASGTYTFDVTSGTVGANDFTSGNITLDIPGVGDVTGTYQLAYTLPSESSVDGSYPGGYTLSVNFDQAAPEPATLLLLGVGLLGLGLLGLKRRKHKA